MTQDISDRKGEERVTGSTDKNEKPEEKAKERRDATPTKVVVRRLPPSLTTETFLEQISPVPEYDYFHFVKPDMSLGINSFSRAYINFTSLDDIIIFRERFDGYVFIDAKGNEYTAVVEFAPFQKVPKNKVRKTDIKNGAIEQDADYLKFLEQLASVESESVPPPEAYLEEIEARARELKGSDGVAKTATTPLLDYIKRKREERRLAIQRARDERKRRDTERRRIREDDRRRKKDRDVDKTREREEQGASTPIKLLRNTERMKAREKEDVERSKETTPSRDHVAKETEKSSVRDQRVKSSRDKERTRDWDRNNSYRGKSGWEKEPFRREGSSGGKTDGRDSGKNTKVPGSSQKEPGKDSGKYKPKEHGDSGRDRFADKERSHGGAIRDKNRERDADRNRERNRDAEKDRSKEKGGNWDRGSGGSGWRFSAKDAPERGKSERKNDTRNVDHGATGDKGGVGKGDTDAGKTSGDERKTSVEGHNAGSADSGAEADVKARQKLRYKDRPARAIYNPGRRAAERRKEAEIKAGGSKADED